jgi:triacylglycerol lipase
MRASDRNHSSRSGKRPARAGSTVRGLVVPLLVGFWALAPFALLAPSAQAASGWGALAAPASAEPAADTTRVPLLVVPGWNDGAVHVEPLRERFVGEGWPSTRVTALDFEDPTGSNADHAREIARAVEALLELVEADRVDIVAHSMGGLAVRHYLQFEGGAQRVRRVVFLGTPHRGSMAAMLAWGDGGREMVPGSDFLNRLNGKGSGIPDGVEALSIRTPTDLRVIPATSAVLAGALNLEICCPTHHQLMDGETRVFEVAARFLREGSEGVPAATVPTERLAWTEERFEDRLGAWSLWSQGWAEDVVRRWFLPSFELGRDAGAGDPGGSGGR